MLYTANMRYIFDPELLRARAGILERLAEAVESTRGQLLRRLATVGRYSGSTDALSDVARQARARAGDLAARADFTDRNGYFDIVGSVPLFSATANLSFGAGDEAFLAALISEVDRKIETWQGTDNDPIFDALVASRLELRTELAFLVEVKAALADVRSALDTGGWGVRRDDLFTIRNTFDRLTPRAADEVMSRLTDLELDVWVDQMQEGVIKGGLKKHERIALLAMVLPKLSLAQLRRLEARSRTVNPPLADGDDYAYILVRRRSVRGRRGHRCHDNRTWTKADWATATSSPLWRRWHPCTRPSSSDRSARMPTVLSRSRSTPTASQSRSWSRRPSLLRRRAVNWCRSTPTTPSRRSAGDGSCGLSPMRRRSPSTRNRTRTSKGVAPTRRWNG